MASGLKLPPSPQWRTDLIEDETACKYAGEFFASWMTTPELLKAHSYRGAGIDVTAGYLRLLFNIDKQAATDGQLVGWFTDSQLAAQLSPNPDDYQLFVDTIIRPSLDNCGASVCKSLGWQGNNDLAGMGVSSEMHHPS